MRLSATVIALALAFILLPSGSVQAQGEPSEARPDLCPNPDACAAEAREREERQRQAREESEAENAAAVAEAEAARIRGEERIRQLDAEAEENRTPRLELVVPEVGDPGDYATGSGGSAENGGSGADGGGSGESGASNRETLQRADIRRMAAYETAMGEGREAERRGDWTAALAAYETAHRNNPTDETQRQVTTHRMTVTAEGLGQAIARFFIGDSDGHQGEFNAILQRQLAETRAIVRRFGESWLARRDQLIEFNVLALSLLTDRTFEGLDDGSIGDGDLPTLVGLDTKDLDVKPSLVVEREAALPATERSDSIFVSSLWMGGIRGYRGNEEFRRRLQGILDGVEIINDPNFMTDALPYPTSEVLHTPVVAFWTEALIEHAESSGRDSHADFDDQIMRWMRPNQEERTGAGQPLLIATNSRERAEGIRTRILREGASIMVAWVADVAMVTEVYYHPNNLQAPSDSLIAATTEAAIPEIDAYVRSLRFFESGRDVAPPGEREHANRFAAESARFLLLELTLFFPPWRDIEPPVVTCAREGPMGHWSVDLTLRREENSRERVLAGGSGWDEPGKWEPGEYRVSCSVDGRVIASDRFEITGVSRTVETLRRRAEEGDAEAQNSLAVRYVNGMGVEQDHEEAVRWYRLSAEQGNALAQSNLGMRYAAGTGVEQDYEEAVRWYRMSAAQGNAAAQNNLGVRYETGTGVEQDDEEAARWYRRAAELGSAHAQNNLGSRYATGAGVEQDAEEAVRWYRMSAEQGHASGQYNLGFRYRSGEGVEQDYDEALRWFRQAAAQGDDKAEWNLGDMYENGLGVEKDEAAAVRHYRRAAGLGHETAAADAERLTATRTESAGRNQRKIFEEIRELVAGTESSHSFEMRGGMQNRTTTIRDVRESGSDPCDFRLVLDDRTEGEGAGDGVNVRELAFDVRTSDYAGAQIIRHLDRFWVGFDDHPFDVLMLTFGTGDVAEGFVALLEELDASCR